MTNQLKLAAISGALLTVLSNFAMADTSTAPALMSSQWAAQACDAWNKTPELTNGLGGKWMANNLNRGYKIIHMYRSDCDDKFQVELRLEPKDGKAICTYGGKVVTQKLNPGADYLMYATTERWHQMGAGEYGPMKAMMFGRLEFVGPKWEAMTVMGPFAQFLLLAGKVPSNESVCPTK
ncbi:MAG: SCP2 sterol-binding domain-containing protein [Betaproteobacteria bacterium]|nr:SCP2 sterol-binding domain-containing protein [Betaproteobacteria bacterium]